jgi:hypothetical protein
MVDPGAAQDATLNGNYLAEVATLRRNEEVFAEVRAALTH